MRLFFEDEYFEYKQPYVIFKIEHFVPLTPFQIVRFENFPHK